MPSFDIVSKTDMTSVDNALQGVTKEMQVRYDFKGSNQRSAKMTMSSPFLLMMS